VILREFLLEQGTDQEMIPASVRLRSIQGIVSVAILNRILYPRLFSLLAPFQLYRTQPLKGRADPPRTVQARAPIFFVQNKENGLVRERLKK